MAQDTPDGDQTPQDVKSLDLSKHAVASNLNRGQPDLNEPLTAEEAKNFQELLVQRIESFRRGRTRWSLTYHASLYLSAVLSAAAAIVPQLSIVQDTSIKKDAASILAGPAALLITLSTAGGFARKWHASRTSKGKAEQIRIELIAREPSVGDVQRLAQLEVDHDKAVLGT